MLRHRLTRAGPHSPFNLLRTESVRLLPRSTHAHILSHTLGRPRQGAEQHHQAEEEGEGRQMGGPPAQGAARRRAGVRAVGQTP